MRVTVTRTPFTVTSTGNATASGLASALGLGASAMTSMSVERAAQIGNAQPWFHAVIVSAGVDALIIMRVITKYFSL